MLATKRTALLPRALHVLSAACAALFGGARRDDGGHARAARAEALVAELQARETRLRQELEQAQAAAHRAEALACRDALTGLANRGSFSRTLEQALEDARARRGRLALFLIDLDRMGQCNDMLGRAAGDAVLQEIARRLDEALGTGQSAARLAGDEFVVLLPDFDEAAELDLAAERLLDAIARPLAQGGQSVRITASIGIGMYPADGHEERGLLKCADISLRHAKASGRNAHAFHAPGAGPRELEQGALAAELRHALDAGQFELRYQPRVDARSGRVAAVEALVHWRHPVHGPVAPARFLACAEESGLIVALGRWVLETAARQQVAWRASGLPSLRMAVRLTPRQFADPGLLRDIDQALARTGLRPDELELAVAESTLLQDPRRAPATTAALKARGLRLTVDGFGAGWSSLAHLERFPLDTLKLDRTLARSLSGPADRALLADARALGLAIVADGVDSQGHARRLCDEGCDALQGSYFSEPLAAARLAKLLRAQAEMDELPGWRLAAAA